MDFDIANEDDILEEFLGLPRHTQKAEPVKTGAVAKEVGKTKPGKLKTDQKLTDDIKTFPTNKSMKYQNRKEEVMVFKIQSVEDYYTSSSDTFKVCLFGCKMLLI